MKCPCCPVLVPGVGQYLFSNEGTAPHHHHGAPLGTGCQVSSSGVQLGSAFILEAWIFFLEISIYNRVSNSWENVSCLVIKHRCDISLEACKPVKRQLQTEKTEGVSLIPLQQARLVPSAARQKDLPKTPCILNPVCQPRQPPPSRLADLFLQNAPDFPWPISQGSASPGQQRAQSPTFWRQEAKSQLGGLCSSNFTLSKL